MRTPPHSCLVGRHEGLLAQYKKQSRRKLCNFEEQRLANDVFVTVFRGLTLGEYIIARKANCIDSHSQPCSKCKPMLFIASCASREGYCMLSMASRQPFRIKSIRLMLPFVTCFKCHLQQYALVLQIVGRAHGF